MKVGSLVLGGIALWGIGVNVAAAPAAEVQPGLGPPIEIHKGLSDKEWPQLGNTPQRTSYSPMEIRGPFRTKWQFDLIAGTPPEQLERYINVPWCARGDLFYMHKLAQTIKAYRGVMWQ